MMLFRASLTGIESRDFNLDRRLWRRILAEHLDAGWHLTWEQAEADMKKLTV